MDWEPSEPAVAVEPPKTFGPGESPLEKLPVEVLGELINDLYATRFSLADFG